jgi:hypothetical protein
MHVDGSRDNSLLAEIATVFPPDDMPPIEALTVHPDGCDECSYLRRDIEDVRGKPIGGELIRLVHQNLACLSVRTLRWIFPHYLRYCLSPDGEQTRMETEFLVYFLSPKAEFYDDSLKRLAFLGENQIQCILHFLDWCRAHPHWGEYFPDDLRVATEFCGKLLSNSRTGTHHD